MRCFTRLLFGLHSAIIIMTRKRLTASLQTKQDVGEFVCSGPVRAFPQRVSCLNGNCWFALDRRLTWVLTYSCGTRSHFLQSGNRTRRDSGILGHPLVETGTESRLGSLMTQSWSYCPMDSRRRHKRHPGKPSSLPRRGNVTISGENTNERLTEIHPSPQSAGRRV